MHSFIDTPPRVLPSPPAIGQCHFELRFESLFQPGRALALLCDESGSVPMDALSDEARRNHLHARAVGGRDSATPAVVRGG